VEIQKAHGDIAAFLGRHSFVLRLEGLRFTRCESRDPRELANYPSQALFEREVDQPGSGFKEFLTENG
jgi:hypothetical protein